MPTTAKDVMDLFTEVVPYLDEQQLSDLKEVLQKTRPSPNTLPVLRTTQQSRHTTKRVSLRRFVPIAKAIVHLVETGHTICLRWGAENELSVWADTDESHPNQPLALRRTYHLESAGVEHIIGVRTVKPPCTMRKLLDRLFMTVLYVLERLSVVSQNIVVDSFGPRVSQFGYPLFGTDDQPKFLDIVEQQEYNGRRLTLDTSATRPLWVRRLTG